MLFKKLAVLILLLALTGPAWGQTMITGLPELAVAPADGDVFIIDDLTGPATKKIQWDTVLGGVHATILGGAGASVNVAGGNATIVTDVTLAGGNAFTGTQDITGGILLQPNGSGDPSPAGCAVATVGAVIINTDISGKQYVCLLVGAADYQWVSIVSDLLAACNVSGATIARGTPVYDVGWNAGQAHIEVEPADANGVATYPVIGIADTELLNNSNGSLMISGVMTLLDTSAWSDSDSLYLSETVGTLTNVRPTGIGDCIEKLGTVLRSHASLGVIVITGANRCNDIPNLEDGKIRIGNGSNAATPVDLSGDVAVTNAGVVTLTDKLRTQVQSFVLNPNNVATGVAQFRWGYAVTLTEIRCDTDAGTVATVNVDERVATTPNTAGTAALTTPLTCDTNQEIGTVFTNASIAAWAPVGVTFGTITTAVVLRVFVEFTID